MADQGTDIEIARAANQLAIADIGAKLEIPAEALHPMGRIRPRWITDSWKRFRTGRAAN